MFIISFVLAFVGVLILLMYAIIGLPHEILIGVAVISLIVSFALSIGGFSIGIAELNYSKKWPKIGVIGNLALILFPIGYAIYLFYGLFNPPNSF